MESSNQFSDKNIERLIQNWFETIEGQQISDQIPVIFEGVSEGQAIIGIDDKIIKLIIDISDGCPYEVETSNQNSKVLQFVEKVNEKLIMREIPEIQNCLKFILTIFSQIVLGQTIRLSEPKRKSDQAIDIYANNNDFMDFSEDINENIDGQIQRLEYQDSEMQNQYENGDEEEEAVDWGLDEDEDEDKDQYKEMIESNIQQDKINEIRQLGISDSGYFPSNVLNYKSVKRFQNSKLYKDCLDALEYLKNNSDKIEGWLNLLATKEFLNIRVEIDLNYVNLLPSNITLLGWNIEEPLTIILDINEGKLLNTSEEELANMDFAAFWNQGMIQYQCVNAGSSSSFGCNDFMREIFKTFIRDHLGKNSSKFGQLEETKSRSSNSNQQNQGSQNTKAVPNKSFWKKMFGQKKVDDEALSELIFMGFELEKAKACLLQNNNDLQKSIDILIDSENLNSMPLFSKQMSKEYSIKSLPPTKNQLIRMMLYLCDRLDSCTHYCILCHQKLESESIKLRACTSENCEFTFEENFTGTIYPELKFNQHEAFLNISLSAKALFSARAGQVFEPFPSFFLKSIQMRGKLGNLDKIAQARVSGQILQKDQMLDESNKDLSLMIEIFQKIPPYQQLMRDVNSEADLTKRFDDLLKDKKKSRLCYKMIQYILATNRSTFIKLVPENAVKLSDGQLNEAAQSIDFNQNFDQYLIIPQDQRKERVFKAKKRQYGSVFCWHGSSTENWYSILRNGLRNVSNTWYMTAGAAYGPGIYASSQYSTSYGYTCRYTQGNKFWNYQHQWIGNYHMIAVCEIIKKKEYDKNSNYGIAVVPDEDDIIVRYLFMIKNGVNYANFNIDSLKVNFENHYYSQLREYNKTLSEQRYERIKIAFNKFQDRKKKQEQDLKRIQEQTYEKIQKAEEEELENQLKKLSSKFSGSKGSQLATQRISKEYVGLMKSTEFKDKIKIEFYQNNMYLWKVIFDIAQYEVSKELKQDFQQLALKIGNERAQLQYEIIFSENYPHEPPFVRVVFPRFAFRTGHVTVGGSICIESLTPSGWSSARSLESYLVEIISLINAGNARLDLQSLLPYSLDEAKQAFNRVARDHGWIK